MKLELEKFFSKICGPKHRCKRSGCCWTDKSLSWGSIEHHLEAKQKDLVLHTSSTVFLVNAWCWSVTSSNHDKWLLLWLSYRIQHYLICVTGLLFSCSGHSHFIKIKLSELLQTWSEMLSSLGFFFFACMWLKWEALTNCIACTWWLIAFEWFKENKTSGDFDAL